MAEVRLSLKDATTPGRLPAVCMQCGKEARAVRRMKLTTARWPYASSARLGVVGLLALLDWFDWWKAPRMRLNAPLCRWHKWIVPPRFHVLKITEHLVHLTGVSDEFVRALNR